MQFLQQQQYLNAMNIQQPIGLRYPVNTIKSYDLPFEQYNAQAYDPYGMNLMNLVSNMNEYHAKDGSSTVFDFAKGDPLATTSVTDLHKDAGGNLVFANSNGKQDIGVVDRFMTGSQTRVNSALGSGDFDSIAKATNDHFDTFNDKFVAFDKDNKEVFGLILLL